MGGKPSTSTPADRRLKENRDLPPHDDGGKGAPTSTSLPTRTDVSNKPWSSISDNDYADAEDYARACLVNMNTGDSKTWIKAKAHLPVREPKKMGGKINVNAVHAAYGALVGARGGVKLPPDQKKAAAKALLRIYKNVLQVDVPEALKNMAA